MIQELFKIISHEFEYCITEDRISNSLTYSTAARPVFQMDFDGRSLSNVSLTVEIN